MHRCRLLAPQPPAQLAVRQVRYLIVNAKRNRFTFRLDPISTHLDVFFEVYRTFIDILT